MDEVDPELNWIADGEVLGTYLLVEGVVAALVSVTKDELVGT